MLSFFIIFSYKLYYNKICMKRGWDFGMNPYILESFITFCDRMIIVKEGFTIQEKLYSHLAKNEDLIKVYDEEINDLVEGIKNHTCTKYGTEPISKHAYDMHVTVSVANLSRIVKNYRGKNDIDNTKEPIVSYYGSKSKLENVVLYILKKRIHKLRNFLDSRYSECEIDMQFKEFIGIGFYNDDKYEFKCARVVVAKDRTTGELYVKSTYPIPYCGYSKKDFETKDVFNVPTVKKIP